MDAQINPEPVLKRILTRIHAGHFRITLSLGWQALLWKILLHTHQNSRIVFGPPKLFNSAVVTAMWSFSLAVLVVLSLAYALRCALRFDSVRSEFTHRVGVNYLFAPWISWMLVVESAPFVTPRHAAFVVLWWVLAVPVVVLDVKVYGQWFTTRGKRFLTAVANPTSQLTVVGNLVGARAAAKMGWDEAAVFLFGLGMTHYFVLLVTLYQRIAGGGGDRLPAILRPTFCLFFGAPSVASVAWYSIAGRFDTAAKMLFFLSLFFFMSLICRPCLFKKAMRRFNVAWWAYSYPITMLTLASIRYEQEVKGGVPRLIRLSLSVLSVVVLFGLLFFTGLNPRLLLPDDDPIIGANPPNKCADKVDSKRGPCAIIP
ncbi:S-type anion channel SLAH1 [Striga asiatica]|uniref:S-type anion channel SLAH1 n=1 Tax=Striga asiatica TaxID=4170 RepID=A0A5A7PS71_STRAF|nr:S-type anion channel SLAH1 [Striga asiatica]